MFLSIVKMTVCRLFRRDAITKLGRGRFVQIAKSLSETPFISANVEFPLFVGRFAPAIILARPRCAFFPAKLCFKSHEV
jgi:hypothetical protein